MTYALIQHFDLGMQGEGYWNFHHMALFTEDAYDALSVKYKHCDFAVGLDHSAGPEKNAREDWMQMI